MSNRHLPRKFPKGLVWLLVSGLISLLTACGLNLPQATPTEQFPESPFLVPAAMINLENTQWLLKSYIDLKGNSVEVLPNSEINISFQNNKIVGLSGCNSYLSEYQVQDDQIALSQISITSKYCSFPEGLMDQEIQYLQTLGTIKRYKIVDQRLQLLDIGGQTVLIYSQLP